MWAHADPGVCSRSTGVNVCVQVSLLVVLPKQFSGVLWIMATCLIFHRLVSSRPPGPHAGALRPANYPPPVLAAMQCV